MGNFCDLRLGLFQSMVLGERPFLNVDVSHKAFPTQYNSLTDLLRQMADELSNPGRNQFFRIDLHQPLEDKVGQKLKAHLSGLEVCYNSDATKRIYKFIDLGQTPAQEMFVPQGGTVRKSVWQYFKEIGRKITYPEMPCIKLGSRTNPIAVPMEFCSIFGNQVRSKRHFLTLKLIESTNSID